MDVETRVRASRFLFLSYSLISARLMDATWNWGSAKPRAWGKGGKRETRKQRILCQEAISKYHESCVVLVPGADSLVSDPFFREPAAGEQANGRSFFIVQQL